MAHPLSHNCTYNGKTTNYDVNSVANPMFFRRKLLNFDPSHRTILYTPRVIGVAQLCSVIYLEKECVKSGPLALYHTDGLVGEAQERSVRVPEIW